MGAGIHTSPEAAASPGIMAMLLAAEEAKERLQASLAESQV